MAVARGRLCVGVLVMLVVASVPSTSGEHSEPTAPGIKWSQTFDVLTLRFSHSCPSQPCVSFERDALVFECPSDKTRGTNLTLREDIKPETAACEHPRQRVTECRLPKEIPHPFDRLEADPAAHSGHISVDWENFDARVLEVHESDEDVTSIYADSDVVSLSHRALQSNPAFVVLDADFSWCSACNRARRQLASVARTLRRHEGRRDVVFAFANLADHRALRHDLNKSCDGTCTLTVYSNTSIEVHTITFDDGDDALRERIKLYVEDPVLRFEDEEEVFNTLSLHEAVTPATWQDRRRSVAVVGVFGHKDAEERNEFLRWCRSRARESFVVGVATATFPGMQSPAIAVYRIEDRGRDVLQGTDLIATKNITRWALIRSLPPVVRLSWTARETMEQLNLPVAHLFVDDAKIDEQMELLRSTADAHRGALVCSVVPSDFNSLRSGFGIRRTASPAFGIAESIEPAAPRFPLQADAITEEMIGDFVSRYLRGELEPAPKSEPAPSHHNSGTLQRVVRQDFEATVHGDAAVMVLFYHGLHPLWGKAEGILEQTAFALSPTSVVLAAYNIANNAPPPGHGDTFIADHLRAFLWIPGRPKPKAYKGSVKRSQILKWLKARVPEVKEKWKDIQQRVKSIKQQTSAALKSQRQRFDDFVDELSHLQKTLVTQDGGIVKHTISAGRNSHPLVAGVTLTAHIIASLPNGTVFDNTIAKDEPFMFKLGMGMVIPCWDIGIAHMALGERAYITCNSEYGYPSRDTPPGVPVGTPLRFEVEVLEMELPKNDEL